MNGKGCGHTTERRIGIVSIRGLGIESPLRLPILLVDSKHRTIPKENQLFHKYPNSGAGEKSMVAIGSV